MFSGDQDITLIIYNPRRTNWDKSTDIREQVKWEHHYLTTCDYVLFWFPQETLCPITLFELGSKIDQDRYDPGIQCVMVGCHPRYKRREDIIVQIECRKLDIPVKDTLEMLVEAFQQDLMKGWN